MAATALTVESLTKAALKIALHGFTGANPDVANNNIFVNTGKTFVAVWADGHDATVIATISPDSATVEDPDFGEIDVDNVVLTLADSSGATVTQMGFVQVPVGYNTAGKCTIVWTSGGGAWLAGEVKVGIIRLDE